MKTSKKESKKTAYVVPFLTSFIFLTLFELLLLTGAAAIPRNSIQNNMKASADYMMEHEVFFACRKSDHASVIDHYADSILLNIIYNYDEKQPVHSALSSSYYYTENHNENYNLYLSVTDNPNPCYDYTRYWHGSAAIVRPLLLFTDIRGIYYILGSIMFILFIVLAVFSKKNAKGVLFPLCLSFCLVSPWYIPMSLEYIWCFIIAFAASIYVLSSYKKKGCLPALTFFIIGNVTAYFDFLTTETLTLLLPAALLIVSEYENGKLTDFIGGFKQFISLALKWGCGYVLCWLAKWSIASAVMGRNVFSEALKEANHRLNGITGGLDGISLRVSALAKNVSCLIPFNFISKYGYVWFTIFILIFLMIFYVIRNPKRDFIAKIFFLIGIIPYIRYFTLGNHSYLHYFFTYRAQMASIFSLCMVLYFGTDLSSVFSKSKRRHSA